LPRWLGTLCLKDLHKADRFQMNSNTYTMLVFDKNGKESVSQQFIRSILTSILNQGIKKTRKLVTTRMESKELVNLDVVNTQPQDKLIYSIKNKDKL
jgi:hypothetical protein